MNIYEFEKTYFQRVEECRNALQCKDSPVPPSEVQNEWSCHVELKIEPTGWQALWKVNRATCEQFKIKYPTYVLGYVNNIYFQDLMADLSIIAVQNDDVQLPEKYEVPLEDLYLTIEQENTELDHKKTADCLDELRFFYRNVWMPWDNDADDNIDWCKTHLESRIRFYFDLKHSMSRAMADHICKLLAEARYIHNKREIMEVELSDEEDGHEDTDKVDNFVRMQLRMAEIRNEIGMLENPIFRRAYEELHFKSKSKNNNTKYDQKANVFIVTNEGTITEQMKHFEAAKQIVGADESVKFTASLKECLKLAAPRDNIFLLPSRHCVKIVEPLNSGGFMKAISSEENNKAEVASKILESNGKCILMGEETDNVFVPFNGDYTIENVIIDCRKSRIGIMVRSGTVTLKNCHIIGDEKSSTGTGISIAGDGKCVLEKTLIQNFGIGIKCKSGGTLVMTQSTISNCGTGLDTNDTSNMEMNASEIVNNKNVAIFLKTMAENVIGTDEKKKMVSNLDELRNLIPSMTLTGVCSFSANKKGNIMIVDKTKMVPLQYSEFLEENLDESRDSGFKKDDVSMLDDKTHNIGVNGWNERSSPISIDEPEESFSANISNSCSHQNNVNVSIISID